jgi:hypothetical protein
MPLIGLFDDPINPTMRLDTVTKKNPNTTISTPSSSLLSTLSPGTNGNSATITASPRLPPITTDIGRSRSVRFVATTSRPDLAAFRCAMLPRTAPTIVGIVFKSVMNPPAATAPAPICFT